MSTAKEARRALVTGASSGIGTAFAKRLARDGYDLVLVARRKERLDELAKQLGAQHHVGVEVHAADLTDSADLHAVEKRITDWQPDMLVNNAGFGGYMPFINLPPERAEELIRLQVLAVTRLTRAALPAMLARRKGDIINVSSRLAFSGPVAFERLPKRAVYAGTKAFINTFTQILAEELKGTGVRVQALCPGVVRTEFHQNVGVDTSRLPPEIIMEADDVVQASLMGLELGEVICLPSLEDKSVLEQSNEAQRQVFESGNAGKLASRYRA